MASKKTSAHLSLIANESLPYRCFRCCLYHHDHGDIEEGEEENGNEEEADEGDLVDRVPLQDHLSF